MAKSSDLMTGALARDDIYEEIFKYLSTDTLLFWEEESSPLRAWQSEIWAEALDKISQSLNLPPFLITDGIFQLRQDEKILQELSKFLTVLSDYQLSGKFVNATNLISSCIFFR